MLHCNILGNDDLNHHKIRVRRSCAVDTYVKLSLDTVDPFLDKLYHYLE